MIATYNLQQRVAALFLLLRLRRFKKRTARWWIRPALRSDAHSEFDIVVHLEACDDECFFKYMRMPKEYFRNLSLLIESDIKKEDTHFRKSVPPEV